MKKQFTLSLLFIVAVLCAAHQANASFFGNKKVELSQASGTVANIDLRKSLVTVISKDGTSSSFMTEDKTVFQKKGKRIGLSDLKKGDAVNISYLLKKGQNRAHAVSVYETVSSKAVPITPKKRK